MLAFEHNGKTFYADEGEGKLQKKLKRLHINESEITNLRTIEIKKREEPIEDKKYDEWFYNVDKYLVKHPNGNISVCYWKKGENPTIKDFFEKLIWNEETKTGLREYTEEYLEKLTIEKDEKFAPSC